MTIKYHGVVCNARLKTIQAGSRYSGRHGRDRIRLNLIPAVHIKIKYHGVVCKARLKTIQAGSGYIVENMGEISLGA
jgi:hypothetical protein